MSSEVFNCSAPDTGNMEVLIKYGSDLQKQKWLTPLLNGEIRSCFGMTEPAVASSDATNMQSTITLDKATGDYIVNGTKWWTSGANDPRCKVCVFMGRTPNSTRGPHQQHSMILISMDTAGVNVKRYLSVFGYDDAPHGHAEVVFNNVRVPGSAMLLGEGRGFEIAQGRLGPGRIHHCMRSIGLSEKVLAMAIKRASERKAFGKEIIRHDLTLNGIAEARMKIDQARLLTLQTAHMMDVKGNKEARQLISMIKIAAPKALVEVIDWAIQIFGGAGVCQDFPLARLYSMARTLRIADGPDEVHALTVGRIEVMSRMRKAKL